jgi:hypothetical protein
MWTNGVEAQRSNHLGERILVRTTSGIGKKDIMWCSSSSERLLSLSTPLLFPVALLESLGMDAGDDISSNRVSA